MEGRIEHVAGLFSCSVSVCVYGRVDFDGAHGHP